MPLDALCLQIKILKLGDVRAFLKRAIEPPNEAAVDAALRSLQELDAVDVEDELTPLGLHLAELPVDARLGKMMLYGAMFSCLDPVLTIAASTGFRSPFLSPMDRRDEADDAKRRLAAGVGATSDHLTLVAAYAGWIRAKARGARTSATFCPRRFSPRRPCARSRRCAAVRRAAGPDCSAQRRGSFPEEQWRTCRYNRCD